MSEWDVVKQEPAADEWEVIKQEAKPSLMSQVGQTAKEAFGPQTWPLYGSGLGTLALSWLGPPGMVAGGGAGGMIGEHLKQMVTGEQAPQRTIQQGQIGAASELGGPLVGAAFKPFAGRVGPAAGRAIDILKQRKLPVSPSSVAPSAPARMFEFVSDWFPTGTLWNQVKRNQLKRGLQRMHQEVLSDLPMRPPRSVAGEAIFQGIKEAKTGLAAQTRSAYRLWENAIQGRNVPMPNTLKLVSKYKDATTDSKLRGLLEMYARKGGTWTADEIDMFQKQLWGTTYKKGGLRHVGKEIKDAMMSDLKKYSPELSDLLQKAKDQSSLQKTFLTNPKVKDILAKHRRDPLHVINETFDPRNFEALADIKKAVDKKTWDTARFGFIEDMFERSTVQDEIRGNVFNPGAFVKNFEKHAESIAKILPEDYQQLRDFVLVLKAAIPDITKGTQKNVLSRLATGAGATGSIGGASYLFGGGAPSTGVIAVPATFSWAAAKSLMNPKGWLKTWLTTGAEGLVPEVIRQAPRLGGRAMMLEGENE